MCISDAETSKFLPASDIYSYAMTCYEVLTGHVPFPAISDRSVEEKVLSGGRPQLPGECPDSLRLLLEECWASDPLKRPSFSEIVRKLENLKYLELRARFATTFQVLQLHPHSEGTSATGLIERTTSITLPDEVALSRLGSRVGAVSKHGQELEAGTSVIDLSKSTTPIITQEDSCYKCTWTCRNWVKAPQSLASPKARRRLQY